MIDQYVLDLCFHKIEKDGETYYWRECVQHEGMSPDEVGYIVVYKDGNHLHTYHYPPDFL